MLYQMISHVDVQCVHSSLITVHSLSSTSLLRYIEHAPMASRSLSNVKSERASRSPCQSGSQVPIISALLNRCAPVNVLTGDYLLRLVPNILNR